MDDNQDKKTNLQQQNQQNRPEKKPLPPKYRRGPFFYFIIALVIFSTLMMLQQFEGGDKIEWSEFITDVNDSKIESVEISDTEITGKYKTDATSTDQKTPKSFRTCIH